MVTIHSPGEAFAGKGSGRIHSSGHIGGNRETLGGNLGGIERLGRRNFETETQISVQTGRGANAHHILFSYLKTNFYRHKSDRQGAWSGEGSELLWFRSRGHEGASQHSGSLCPWIRGRL